MMKTIRRMEEDYKDGSHFIFIIQVGTGEERERGDVVFSPGT